MDLSIIIVNWNTAKLLRLCLNSLECKMQNAKCKINFEVIVVDNGSTDHSVEMIKQYAISHKELAVKLIENEENLGFAKAVNQALRQVYTERNRSAQGGTVLLLNSDTVIKKGVIEKLLQFEEKVRPAIIGARMLNPDGTIQASCFYLPTIRRAVVHYWLAGKKYFEKFFPEKKEPVQVEAVSGGAMLISKEIVERLGLLDERYFMYFEDLDYCRRAHRSGFKIYYLPSAEVVHEHGASGRCLAKEDNQWKRLIPSSKTYHGVLRHCIISGIIWTGQKIKRK